MNYRILMRSELVFGCAIGFRRRPPTSSQTKSTIPGEITVTSCVERADQMSAPTTAGTTVDSLSFVLIHAARGTTDDLRAAGTSGTKPDVTNSMYRLDVDVAKMNPHVGHQVEVTGTLEAATATTDSADPSSATNSPKLKIDRVKMVSETCARQPAF